MSTLFASQLTAAGFVRAPMTDIVAALNELWKTAYGNDADLSPRSPDGQVIGGIAEMFDDLNGALYDLYQGLVNPNGATGQMLSGLMVLTGVPRTGATYSSAPGIYVGTAGTTVPTTLVVQSTLDESLWSPVAEVVLDQDGHGTVPLRCTKIGPVPAGKVPAGTLTTIQTPVNGLTSVTNSLGVCGVLAEGDPNGRIRRQQSVAVAAQGVTDAIQAALLKLSGVQQAVVWENPTPSPMSIGSGTVNPNSVYAICVVEQGSDSDPTTTPSDDDPIATTIRNTKGAACGTQGSIIKYVVDRMGHSQAIKYDLAEGVIVHIRVRLTPRYNWPLDGATQIAAAIGEWALGANAATGKPNIAIGGDAKGRLSWTDVLGSFLNRVPGFDLVALQFSTNGGSTWQADRENVNLTAKQIALIASANVTVEEV